MCASLYQKMISMRCCLLLTLLLVNQSDGGIGLSPWEFFLGNGGEVDKAIPISFKPEEGLRLREKFEKKYGPRGEKLISSFGDGLPVDEYGSQ